MISVHEPECKLVWKALPSMIQIFKERMTLIKKWYAAWNESQRWTLLEYVLRQQDDEKLTVIHDLLHPVLPSPDHDFTRVLPRCLCLRIFSLLDPQSLCRAAQVILVAVYKRYICIVLMKHKRHHSTSTHVHTHTCTHAYTHTHTTRTHRSVGIGSILQSAMSSGRENVLGWAGFFPHLHGLTTPLSGKDTT